MFFTFLFFYLLVYFRIPLLKFRQSEENLNDAIKVARIPKIGQTRVTRPKQRY